MGAGRPGPIYPHGKFQIVAQLPKFEFSKEDDSVTIYRDSFGLFKFVQYDPKKTSLYYIYEWILCLGVVQIRKWRPEGFWTPERYLADHKEEEHED